MNTFDALMQGFAMALEPSVLMYGFLGCIVGTMVGVLPGIGPALTIALLLPLTFKAPAAGMFVLFAGIYYGAMYGGSTTSILLNTPGESATVMTAVEGNQMARKGRGGAALATAAIGSFIAGTIGTLALTFASPWVVEAALKFGPAEYFSLMVLALVAVTAVLGSSVLRGLVSLAAGLLFGLAGIDLQTGQPRFTFGQAEMLDGVEMTIAVVGLFAVGEAMFLAWQGRETKRHELHKTGKVMLTREDWKRSWKPWLRGSFIGFPIGAMPAGGAELPTLLSYYTEKKLSPHKEEFGKGAIEGVAGPEAANNASAAGVLMPLPTLGIPTSATAAVILTAFESYGLRPGPTLFTEQGGLVWTLIASLYIGNVILLILNLPLVGLWVKLLRIPAPWLYAGIIVISAAGVYGASKSTFDLLLLFGFGLLGFAFRRFDFPAAPLIIGLILGPMAEQSLRQALTISMGSYTTFVTRPLSATILAIAVLLLVLPAFLRWRERRQAQSAFARSGRMTALLSAAQSQVLLVDYQQRLLPALSGGETALSNAMRLALGARLLAIPVAGVEENPARLGPMPEALRSVCHTVMPKMAFDACADGLGAHLAARAERPHLVVAGCEAHVCLLQTVLGLRAAAWDVWVVEDACASRTEANRDAALRRLAAAQARLVTTEMVLFEWVRRADHDRFGEVLRLIK